MSTCLAPKPALLGALLLLTACGARNPTVGERQANVLGDLYAAYDQQLAQLAPAYVVVTYPSDLESMPAHKRAELRVVRSVLGDRRIGHELRRHADTLVTLVNEKHWKRPEFRAYVVPDAAVACCRAKTLLYLNLDVRDPACTQLHPVASANRIAIKVWDDPVTMPKAFTDLWAPAAASE